MIRELQFEHRWTMDNIVYRIDKESPLLTQTTSNAQEGVIVLYNIVQNHRPNHLRISPRIERCMIRVDLINQKLGQRYLPMV